MFTTVENLSGVVVSELKTWADTRGNLVEAFREDTVDLEHVPAMGYLSTTYTGVCRGPHEHLVQTDMFVFPGMGSFVFSAWNNIEESPDYKKKVDITLPSGSAFRILVYPGIVHGYACVAQGPGVVLNFPNKLYRGWGNKDDVDEIRHEEDKESPFVKDFKKTIKKYSVK